MNLARRFLVSRNPASISKWLLIASATSILAVLGIPAFQTLRQGEPDVFLLSFAILPWMAGPSALAALLTVRARSGGEAWCFVGSELVVVVSTASLLMLVTFVRTGHANSESAVGLLLLPVVQFAAVLAFALGVVAIADLGTTHQKEAKPRIALLTILLLSSAALLTVLAWTFGYIKT